MDVDIKIQRSCTIGRTSARVGGSPLTDPLLASFYLNCWQGLLLLACSLSVALGWQPNPPLGPATEPAKTVPLVKKGEILTRQYYFQEAGKQMDYLLYVPRSFQPGKKMPLVVALHGLLSTPGQIIRYPGMTRLAEKHGFIVVAPWGYNNRGWYGSLGQRSRGMRPENLGELSEKDVMNVLATVQQDFPIDAKRIYLLGHSMGGGGAFHLAIKYPQKWGAVATIAPAVYADPDQLQKIKHLPVIIVQGAKDGLVSVKRTRRWVEKMKQLKMNYRYIEVADGGHIFVAFSNLPMIFDFLAQQPNQQTSPKPKPAGG